MHLQPVTLSGRHVCLEPLSRKHFSQLYQVGLDPQLVAITESYLPTREGLQNYLEKALSLAEQGLALPFAVVHQESQQVIGSTRFANIDRAHRRLEIGWTWYAKEYQRTAVNTECKYLLLMHAFETLGCQRVEFKIDSRNERSRQAILRLGAKEEGTFRKHMLLPSGYVRDTVYFSIVDDEWQRVKEHLRVLQKPIC